MDKDLKYQYIRTFRMLIAMSGMAGLIIWILCGIFFIFTPGRNWELFSTSLFGLSIFLICGTYIQKLRKKEEDETKKEKERGENK